MNSMHSRFIWYRSAKWLSTEGYFGNMSSNLIRYAKNNISYDLRYYKHTRR